MYRQMTRIGRRGSPPPQSIRGPASIGRWADMPASKSMEIYSTSASQARARRQLEPRLALRLTTTLMLQVTRAPDSRPTCTRQGWLVKYSKGGFTANWNRLACTYRDIATRQDAEGSDSRPLVAGDSSR